MQVTLKNIRELQKSWKESKSLSEEEIKALMELSNLLIKKLEENNNNIKGVSLLYPDNCSNLKAFRLFAYIFSAVVTVRSDCGGLRMNSFGKGVH